MTISNQVTLTATLLEKQALRLTPAGIPILEVTLLHESEQQQNGMARRVTLEAVAKITGPLAKRFVEQVAIGQALQIGGFLASAGQKQRSRLVLHIEQYELLN
ncbi:primosomal replication protein N [Silvimonas sp. JCM 19000]